MAAMNPKKTKKRGKKASYKPAKRNPALYSKGERYEAPRRKRGKRNPRGIGSFSLADVGKASLAGVGGALATRSLPQMLLGAKNTGAMGYLANAAVAIGGGYGLAAFMAPLWGMGWIVGGLTATGLRIWSDHISQTSAAALSGLRDLGDLDFSSDGIGYLRDFVNTPFPLPTTSENVNGNYVVQDPYPAQLPAPAPAPAAAAPGSQAPGAKSPAPAPAHSRLAPRFQPVM